MPDNNIPSPNELFSKKTTNLPSPNELFSRQNPSAYSKLREGSAVEKPVYTTAKDLEIDKSLEFIQANSRRNMRDDEKKILREMMVNPNTSKEELSDAIVTLQGGKSKQADNTISTPDYYMKRNEVSGNYVPVALGEGEKIPAGYRAASLWGTQESANDDSALMDVTKSIANGAIKAVGGVIDVLQTGTELVTGSESESLRKAQNSMQALEFNKDKALSENPLYKTDGIETFSDIFDASRVDLGPKALWGAFNGLTESLTEFGLATRFGVTAIKGAKALNYGLKGLDTALDLGKAAQKAAIFTGSYITQLGDNLDRADEAGLTGRDRSAVASLVTVPMAALDAFWGLDGKIMSSFFNKSKSEILKNVIKTVERDEAGNITKNGFKQLSNEVSVQYGKLAKNGAKEIVKDAFSEGSQEAAQEFSQKAGEQLWDKMSDEDKAKYGTDAFSAKSFGDYASSFATGLVSGVPMAIASQSLKSRHDAQSTNAYETVKEGPKAVEALKTNLNNALEKNEITPEEHAEANFKIDAYSKYQEETKGTNLKPDEEQKAFELSFQIQGIKTEIPTNENEISKLDPISRAKVESKQKQAKELQSELNEIVLKGAVKGEPIVSKKTEEKIIKDREEKAKENIADNKTKIKQRKESVGKWEDLIDNSVSEKELDAVMDQMVNAGEETPDLFDYVSGKRTEFKVKPKAVVPTKTTKVKSDFERIPYKDDKRSYSEISTEEFNSDTMDSRKIHATFRKEASTKSDGKINGIMIPRPYKYDNKDLNTYQFESNEDGKRIRFASSMINDVGYRGHMRTERLKGDASGIPVFLKMVDLGKVPEEYKDKMPEGYTSKKKILGIYQASDGVFLGWAKETHKGDSESLDKNGNSLYNSSESDLIHHIETKKENPLPPEQLAEIRKPKPTPTERAKEATDKIVKEGKEKVESARLTNQVSEAKNVDVVDEKASEKESGGINSQGLLKLAYSYNQLGKNEKKLEAGVNLFKKIQTKANELDLIFELFGGGKISLYNKNKSGDKGRKVVTIGVKRDVDVIQKEKDEAKEFKAAKKMPANDINHAIALDVVNGTTFDLDEFRNLTDSNTPIGDKFLFNGKNVVKFDNYASHLASMKADDFQDVIGADYQIGRDAANALVDYIGKNGKQLAKEYVLKQYRDANVNDVNRGMSEEEIAYLQDLEDKLKLENKEVQNIDEALNNVNREELNQIKVELKDEKNRNEENADRIVAEHGGIKIGSENSFDESESEQDSYNEEGKDLIKGEEGYEPFQKPAELQYAEGQLKKAEIELTTSKKLLDAKRKELDKGIVEDREDLFGDRKSTDTNSLFDERVDLDAREETLAPFKQRYENAQKDFAKQTAKVKELEDKGDTQTSLFQKQKKVATKVIIDKIVEKIQKALPKVKVVYDENLKAAGRWSPSTNTITINPFYAGKDTPIHEAGHVLIDAMGYNNKIIQAAIKQLKTTPLYAETKERYKELSEQELDKEVLAEAIGREGADIFDKIEDRSKFKAYLDYIFDWLKQKLGLDKNIAKSLAKQIIGGVKTKSLEGTNTGKEQLQKTDPNKKNPIGVKPLKFEQYATENGFNPVAENEKIKAAKEILDEAEYEKDLAKKDAEDALTDEEANKAEAILEEKTIEYDKAYKNYRKIGKRKFEYFKYKKDFNAIQELMSEKEIVNYTTKELQDLISKLHAFDNKAAKSFRNEAMLKLAMIVTKKQQEIFKDMEGYVEELAKTKDISPLQKKILHYSHFGENNPDVQALGLAFGNAVMDKIIDANTKKATHEKLGQKVIAEENKRLGIIGAQANRFSSDSAKYFEWMINEDGELLTVDEAKGLSDAKLNYLKFTRETIADFKGQLEEGDFENTVMDAIRIDKGFMEAYKSEGLLPAFSYYLGGGANNLGKVRIMHNGQIKSYSEIEKEILATANRKSIPSMTKALWDLLVANITARKQLSRGFNVDEKENPLELKGEAEYSLNEKGQLVSKFDKPRAKDRGYSKDFYKAMNQFIDESAHAKHISKIMPLVDSIEYLNKNGYMEEGFAPKRNVSQWIEEWKALHIFKEPYVNDPVLDASIKFMRKLVASTTMWFNIPANVLNVFMGNYSNWRQENGKTIVLGNKRLFGGKGKDRGYGLDIIKKYNIVNQDYDSNATMKAGAILSKIGTWGTQVGEYQIQGSLGLGLLSEDEFNSFEYTKDKYGNEVLTLKEGVDEAKIKAKMLQVKNRITDIQGKYPDEDRRNIMRGEIGKAAFQFKVWIPDWFKERFSAKYINAYGVEKEGTLTQLLREGTKQIKKDIAEKGITKALWENKAFMSNIKGLMTIGTLMALAHQDDDDEKKKKGALNFQNALSQVLFILDLEQDKYMVSNPLAVLGKSKDLISAFDAMVSNEDDAFAKLRRVLPANKVLNLAEMVTK